MVTEKPPLKQRGPFLCEFPLFRFTFLFFFYKSIFVHYQNCNESFAIDQIIYGYIFFFCRAILSRKGSEDLPASEYYKIYQQSKKSSFSGNAANYDLEDMESKSEVKVQGGGIAER